MLRLAFDFIITWRETRTRPNAYFQTAGEGYGATYRGFHHLLRIDYLFHSTLLEGIKYKVIPYDMSDHNPVYLEVGL